MKLDTEGETEKTDGKGRRRERRGRTRASRQSLECDRPRPRHGELSDIFCGETRAGKWLRDRRKECACHSIALPSPKPLLDDGTTHGRVQHLPGLSEESPRPTHSARHPRKLAPQTVAAAPVPHQRAPLQHRARRDTGMEFFAQYTWGNSPHRPKSADKGSRPV